MNELGVEKGGGGRGDDGGSVPEGRVVDTQSLQQKSVQSPVKLLSGGDSSAPSWCARRNMRRVCDVISRAVAARVVETRREPAVARHQPAPHKLVTSSTRRQQILLWQIIC